MKSRSGPVPIILPRELEALRALLDARLTALEAALVDPNQHGSLEQIILDLARVATEEADAAARQAYLEAQREGQGAIAAARAEGRTALETEQAAAAALRTELDQSHAALQEKRAADAAGERDLAAVRQALEQEQIARSSLLREFGEAQAALETERAAVAALRQGLEQAQSAHQSERTAGLDRDRDFAAVHQALEHELKQEQTAHANLRRELDEARAAAAALEQAQAALQSERTAGTARDRAAAQQALEQAQAALQSERTAGTARDRDLAAAHQTLEHELKREQTAHAKLRKALEAARGASEGDRAKTQADLEHAVRDAEMRAETAIREHQALLGDVDAVRQAAAAAEAAAQARYEQLRDATDPQIRRLELAAREADERAASAERELDLLRREARPHTRDAAPPREPATKAAHAPAAPAEATPTPDGPVRAAKRIAMSGEVDIQIDGIPSKLIDLSTTGAQILSPGALKPNRLVSVTLPLGDGHLSCKGKIVWSQLEPARKGRLWYRAGVSFISVDQAALEAFLSQVRSKK